MQPAHDPRTAALDRAAVRAEMESARRDFHRLIDEATPADLRRPSDGTKWTNRQLLFHTLFGYLVVRALLILVRVFGLLPDEASKAFAKLLDSAHRPVRPDQLPGLLHRRLDHPGQPHDPDTRPRDRSPPAAHATRNQLHPAPRHALPHPALPLPPAPAHTQPATYIAAIRGT